VGPLDPEAPPAPLVVDPVGPLVVDEEPPCPDPLLVVLEVSEVDDPVGPVLAVVLPAVSVPVVSHMSTLGSHLEEPDWVQPAKNDAPIETMAPTPKKPPSRKLRGMCFLSLLCPRRRALVRWPTHDRRRAEGRAE
jgi:hypothetical protein